MDVRSLPFGPRIHQPVKDWWAVQQRPVMVEGMRCHGEWSYDWGYGILSQSTKRNASNKVAENYSNMSIYEPRLTSGTSLTGVETPPVDNAQDAETQPMPSSPIQDEGRISALYAESEVSDWDPPFGFSDSEEDLEECFYVNK